MDNSNRAHAYSVSPNNRFQATRMKPRAPEPERWAPRVASRVSKPIAGLGEGGKNK